MKTKLDSNACQTYTWGVHPLAAIPVESGELRYPEESCVVTKKEIVKAIADEIGLTQLKTKEIVQKTFDAIIDALVEGRRIELRNFGVFEVKERAARKARNPRTGQRVHVPAKLVVTFKPGKEMEERVRQLERKQFGDRAASAEIEPEASSEGRTPQIAGDGPLETHGEMEPNA